MPNLHQSQPVLTAGPDLREARAAMILLHGRGANAWDILGLADALECYDIAYLAPDAANATWYPNRFLAPVESNEPWLSSALRVVDDLLERVARSGMPTARTFILGFSQGGCLGLEYLARNPRALGGMFALSAAMIENGDKPRQYFGSLQGTPVLFGCSDRDPHIPIERVRRSIDLMRGLQARVIERIYPNMGHMVNADEIATVRDLIGSAGDGAAPWPRVEDVS
ncbi:MAG: alpha/beta hydrolase [Thermoflexales bacterium]|nr:alpha/beta hydrolase [Thermoflexales bacterium]